MLQLTRYLDNFPPAPPKLHAKSTRSLRHHESHRPHKTNRVGGSPAQREPSQKVLAFFPRKNTLFSRDAHVLPFPDTSTESAKSLPPSRASLQTPPPPLSPTRHVAFNTYYKFHTPPWKFTGLHQIPELYRLQTILLAFQFILTIVTNSANVKHKI